MVWKETCIVSFLWYYFLVIAGVKFEYFIAGNECRKTFQSLTEEKKEPPKEKEKEKPKEDEKDDKKTGKKPSKAPTESEPEPVPNHKVISWFLYLPQYFVLKRDF